MDFFFREGLLKQRTHHKGVVGKTIIESIKTTQYFCFKFETKIYEHSATAARDPHAPPGWLHWVTIRSRGRVASMSRASHEDVTRVP